jgi:3'(2'), 5'-bisphosphate nucleotidase
LFQASSLSVAEKAGEIIRDVMLRGELGVVDKVLHLTGRKLAKPHNLQKILKPLQGVSKDDFDPQTEADRSAQMCIIGSLTKQYSNLKIIGEEGVTDCANVPPEFIVDSSDQKFLADFKCPEQYKNIAESDLVVWVDPLDGTSEYVHGFLEHVTVLIGISFRESAIGGIIHQPYYKCSTSGKLGRTIWGVKDLGTGGFTSKKAPENKFIITTTRSHSNALVQTTLDSIRPDEVIRVGGW